MVTAPGAAESVEFELYRVDPGFFRDDGDRPPRRPHLRGGAGDGRQPPSPTRRRGGRRDGAARLQCRASTSSPPAASVSPGREQAIGRTLLADDGDVEAVGRTPVTVIGVVDNSRFRSIRDPLAPMIFVHDRLQPGWLLVRYAGAPAAVRERIAPVWQRIAPDVPFEAEFADDIVRDLYAGEAARAALFAGFAGACGSDRLPRAVRPCRLHRRAADQGDRHPEGARRAHPRHRPACWSGSSAGRC